MKVKAKAGAAGTKVKMLIQHVMETGRRKDDAGKLIPGHYITEVTATHKDEIVFHAELGPAVSKDPYLAFKFDGAASGDMLTVAWVDSKGKSEVSEIAIR